MQDVEHVDTSEISPKPAAGPATLQQRLEEALSEIMRLQSALEEANQQQEWALASVVKANEAEKEELSQALECVILPWPLEHVTWGGWHLPSRKWGLHAPIWMPSPGCTLKCAACPLMLLMLMVILETVV
jgi:hypothetical protein